MKSVLAVSSGVDSMVLFDLALCGKIKDVSRDDIIVAHFNHGTRPSADEDQKFVERICAENNIKFVSQKIHLGENISEEQARKSRYNFLFNLAPAEILTAHHLDDLAESIAINLARGTGWRGLTPLRNQRLRRPFLELNWTRTDILKYAAEHKIIYRFDPTNADDKYLRNRIREKIQSLDLADRKNLYKKLKSLYDSQCEIREEIEHLTGELLGDTTQFPRDWFKGNDYKSAHLELLRKILSREGISATTPQLEGLLDAIKIYAPNKKYNLPKKRFANIQKTYFNIEK